MNAVVALCHFCEVHGPKIIFYTQVFHDIDRYAKQHQATTPNGDNHDNESKASSNSSSSKVDSCDACGSIPVGQRGLVSFDKSADIVYVSRHDPDSPELYTALRHACIRSLSCEICPGREGPVIFGDSFKGYVFSYTFSLKDVEARGQQKWYSIIIVSKDKIFLINSWNFFTSHIQKVTSDLQSKALKVYESEKKQVKRNPYRTIALDLGPLSRKRSGTGRATRSLTDILKDSDIFTRLHSYFTWMLKEGARHFTERSLEGPSLNFDNNFIDIDKKYTIDAHFDSILQLSQTMNREDFLTLCQHVILGNQIIIRSSVDSLVSSAIDILQSLLPSDCCKVIYKNTEYQDSWKCNFLGLNLCTEIPQHVLASDLYALLDIIPLAHQVDNSAKSGSICYLRIATLICNRY
ncbi:uncharacterized protein TRIADDRAFT_53485 [Trichoplax adhaerens]|uniref:Folliculin n=1 Tax=Trichoplax adhaerens TaxID=10228 RepID=B3RPC5_TRIAD|nr:hypothetical protein TRIADDRAFT_53485 [Trichoplax adhaerens]EDV28164.1 hypothetical protein TRIADDRAFT_53485 [Trichoplax adhaerens]|eukprot:XP_002109998.1 hypothetical protein TRIADDRAFT_53485 [Trichoplax adhaerens]